MSGDLIKISKIAFIIIATAATLFFVFSTHIFTWNMFLKDLPIIPLSIMLGGLPLAIILYKWVNMDSDQFNDWFSKPIMNATLTCKNGHTCRVWVSYSGRGFYYKDIHGDWGMTYRIGGSPIVNPDTCPECGAPWSVPHKHHEHNLDEKHNKKH